MLYDVNMNGRTFLPKIIQRNSELENTQQIAYFPEFANFSVLFSAVEFLPRSKTTHTLQR